MPDDKPGSTLSRSEFYRIVGQLYFFCALLSFASLGAAGFAGVPGNLVWLVVWFLVALNMAAWSIYYSVRSMRERKREADAGKRAGGA